MGTNITISQVKDFMCCIVGVLPPHVGGVHMWNVLIVEGHPTLFGGQSLVRVSGRQEQGGHDQGRHEGGQKDPHFVVAVPS